MKLTNIFIGIGVALGMACGVPVLFFIANNTFYRGNDAQHVIPAYMNNSVQLNVKVPHHDPFHPSTTLFTFKDTLFKSTLKKNGNGYLFKGLFYSNEYKKYFLIRLFDYSGTMYLPEQIEDKKIIITVNKDDFNNSSYGSKTNPVPVFKFKGVTPLKFGDFDYDISPSEFKYNVTQYLTYMLPKDEFKKRFGK